MNRQTYITETLNQFISEAAREWKRYIREAVAATEWETKPSSSRTRTQRASVDSFSSAARASSWNDPFYQNPWETPWERLKKWFLSHPIWKLFWEGLCALGYCS